jgi:hypothetical protein
VAALFDGGHASSVARRRREPRGSMRSRANEIQPGDDASREAR